MVASTIYPLGVSNASPVSLTDAIVEIRPSTNLAWTRYPGLYAVSCSKEANGVGRAELRYEHGYIARKSYSLRNPRDLLRNWVRISWTTTNGTTQYWHGVITGDGSSHHGRQSIDQSGEQTFMAEEASWALSRGVFKGAYVYNSAGNINIDECPAINTDPYTHEKKPNKRAGQLAFEFKDSSNQEWWTPQDILTVLFGSLWQTDNHPTMTIGGFSTVDYHPQIKLFGRTYLDIIQDLFDIRRGFVWWLNHAIGGCVFMASTHAVTAVSLPMGGTIPANPVILSLLTEDKTSVQTVVYHRDSTNKFEQVFVRGARRQSVCTLEARNQLVADWSSAELAAYKAVPSTGHSVEEKQLAGETYWSTPPVDKVFSSLRVDALATLQTADDVATTPTEPLLPFVWNDGQTIEGAERNLVWELAKVSLELPLRQDRNYLADPSNPTSLSTLSYEETRPAFAGLKIKDRYYSLDKIGPAASAETKSGSPNGIKWTAELRNYRKGAGVKIKVTHPQHVIANEDVTPGELPTWAPKPVCNWRDFFCTVLVEFHMRCEVSYPPRPVAFITGQASVRIIDVDERFQMIWCPKGTVLSIDGDGKRVRTAQSGWIKNNATAMYELAQLAWEWYKIERQNVRFVCGYMEGGLGMGSLISELGFGDPPTPINTVVSSIDWNFMNNTTTINTSGAEELDFAGLV